MEDDSKLKALRNEALWPLLLKLSWPALVSMTLNALYNVIDRFYIGQGCGQDAIAGITLTFPIMMAMSAFGPLIGIGHGALISIRLGQKNFPEAEKALGELVALKILLFLTIPPLIFFNIDWILNITGGDKITPAAFTNATDYLNIVIFSHIFSHLAFGLSSAMRSEGAARQSMMCMAIGFTINLILDPIFIFWFDWGVKGAAWATVIAMLASCIWALWYYLSGASSVKLKLTKIWIYPSICIRALGIGLGPFLQHLCGSLVNFSLNMAFAFWSVTKEEATMQFASVGIFQASLMMFFMPLMGVQQGLAPIIGYNWGARNYDRVKKVVLMGLTLSTAIVTLAWLLFLFYPELLARCFADAKNDLTLISQSAKDLRLANCMLWCIGLNVVATTYFQSIGKPKTAIILSLMRQMLCLIPCIWLLPYITQNASLGIWLATPVSDIIACIATAIPFFLHIRFLSKAAKIRISPT